MKRIAILPLLLALVACGGGESDTPSTDQPPAKTMDAPKAPAAGAAMKTVELDVSGMT